MNISNCFEILKQLILLHNTFDVGSLEVICNTLFAKQNYDIVLIQQIENFVEEIYEVIRNDKNKISTPDTLTFIILESLLFNLYSKHKKIDTFRLNNSFYMSQGSMDLSQYSMHISQQQEQIKKFLSFLIKFLSSKKIFKKLSLLIEFKKSNEELNRRYLNSFFETIEYILSKQKIPRDEFFEMKKIFNQFLNSYTNRKEQQQNYLQEVNKIVFSNKLDKIIKIIILNETERIQRIFALIRIYLSSQQPQKRKCFRDLVYNGKQICQNLFRNYIASFNKKSELFNQSKNPLYLFILYYLYALYLPTISKFAQILNQLLSINDNFSVNEFFKNSTNIIKNNLKEFIQLLPYQLIETLIFFRDLINARSWKDSIDSLIPIKVLFFNRFLFNSEFFQIFYKDFDEDQYENLANIINDLFFTQALKKHKNTEVQQLILQITQTFQNKMNIRRQNEEEEPHRYFIEETIIKFDYNILHQAICQIQYTPIDEKEYEIITKKLLEEKKFMKLDSDTIKISKPFQKIVSDRFIKKSQSEQYNKIEAQKIDYDLFKLGLNWETKAKQLQEQKLLLKERKQRKREKKVVNIITFNKSKKEQVVRTYNEYKLSSLF